MRRRSTTHLTVLLLISLLAFTSILVHACSGLELGSITITASPTTIAIGESTTISGTIDPPHEENVTIFFREIGNPSWSSLPTVTTNAAGYYSCSWTTSHIGTYEFKGYWVSDTHIAESLPPHPEVDVVGEHNIAIIGVFASPTSASVGDAIDVEVNVENKGHFTETFEVYAYADRDPPGFPRRYCFGCDPIGEVLVASAKAKVRFTWVTSGVDEGTYTITAEIPAVPGETDKTDNTGTDKVTLSEVHDIAITDVVASPSEVAPGDSVSIEVSLENQGTEEETFDVIVKYNATAIDTHSVTLAAGATTTESFVWVTSGVDEGTYTITAEIPAVPGETDKTDNIHTDSTVKIVFPKETPVASFTYSPLSPVVNGTVIFNASASYDPDGTIVSYEWVFGDGASTTGKTVGHVYAGNGTYTVTLNVTDNDGLSNDTTKNLTVLNTSLNTPPNAAFTESAETVYTGEIITFNASDSYDPDGNITSYSWDFGDGTNATGVTTEHSYPLEGDYTVTLTVTDDDGAANSTSASKTVLKRPPVAVFTESAEEVYTNETIYFNASESYDLDGEIVSYFWDFGDGTNCTGVVVEYAYADNGNYTVTLTVTDDDNATDTATATKEVLNRPPVAKFVESAETAYVGETITFNASDSYDLDGTIATYFWDFGDETNTTGIIVNHTYDINGAFTVTLNVTDDDGASNSSSATKTILINEPPVALFTESAEIVYTGEVIAFGASDSYDPDGNITSYLWDFGDETNATGLTVDHAYADDGFYTVTLIVTDDDGGTASKTAVKAVVNRSPVASFTENPTTVLTGEIIHFNASGSSDPDGSIISYFWDFGDGTDKTGATVSHAYQDDGNYTVTLLVTDDDGETTSKSAIKTVSNRLPIAVFAGNATVVNIDEAIRFDASGSYDVDGSIISYFWDFGDETNTTMAVILDHIYAKNGDHTVTLTVTDDDGASSSTCVTVTVKTSTGWPLALVAGIAVGIAVSTGTVIYTIYGRKKGKNQ